LDHGKTALQGERDQEAFGKDEGSETELGGDVEPFKVLKSRLHDGCPGSRPVKLVERRRGRRNVERDDGGYQ
jgi:hypothetical protein